MKWNRFATTSFIGYLALDSASFLNSMDITTSPLFNMPTLDEPRKAEPKHVLKDLALLWEKLRVEDIETVSRKS